MSFNNNVRQGADFKAIRIIPGTKTTYDINDKKGMRNYQSYRDLYQFWMNQEVEPHERISIGLMAAVNRLVIIDVDAGGATHKHDGRAFWESFAKENSIPMTYTVKTRNGGYHFYFKLPEFYTAEEFSPPGQLANGVDIVYNGYVVAPPTAGYQAYGSIYDIEELPATLILAMENVKNSGNINLATLSNVELLTTLPTPYSEAQISELRGRLKFFQEHGNLSYQEWRDGLFSLKAGLYDKPDILKEFALMWTCNQTYMPGDEAKAMSIIDNATEFGGVGPGTIFALLKSIAIRENAITVASPHTRMEIVQRAGVRFTSDKDGYLKVEPSESNASNIIKVIYPQDRLYFDVRRNSLVFDNEMVPDHTVINKITPVIQSEAGLGLAKIKQAVISKAVEIITTERTIDPHKQMLLETEWDGTPRIERFFELYCGVPKSEYTRLVSKNFWISMAARGVKPGSKVDSMVVLEGGEGIRKSSLVRAIGGVYTHANGTSKLMVEQNELAKCHQATVVELPELIGLKGLDPNVLKGFLTQTSDLIRPPYGRRAFEHPRGFVFIGTTNESKYIPAGAGIRRFWPIAIPKGVTIRTEAIARDREQLFAEAVSRFQDHEDYWTIPAELLREEVAKRRLVDPLHSAIADYVNTVLSVSFGTVRIKPIDVYTYIEGRSLISRGFTTYINSRIESVLEELGFQPDGVDWVCYNENKLYGKAVDFGGMI